MLPILRMTGMLLLVSSPTLAAPSLILEQAITLALERSPQLLSAQAEIAAARARVTGASLFLQDNPELEGALGPRFRSGGNSTDISLGVSQRLELFGQRGARAEAARAQLFASEARLQALKVELVADVREAFARALAARQELLLAQNGRELARQALQAAEERLEAGAASRLEVNAARVELGQAYRERVRAAQRLASSLAELRLLLGFEPGEAINLAGELRLEPHPPPPLAALVALAAKQRPDLKAARAELEAASAERRLATREALPSPRIGASYSREEGASIIQGTIGIELPLFNRNQAARGVGAARVEQAEAALRALERAVRSEVEQALESYRAASATAEVFDEDDLSALQQNLELVNEAYRAGKMDFLELLVIRREALNAQHGFIDALEDLAAADARLQRATGSLP